jgi:hypothetical protein
MAVSLAISPTLLLRIRAGDIEVQNDRSDLAGMYTFFYSNLRFLMPEAQIAYRFPLSDFLETTIYAEYGLSVLDTIDTSLPWYDQMRVSAGIRFDLIPPLSGLARDRDPAIDVPELSEQESAR